MQFKKLPAAAAAYCDLTPLPFPAVILSRKLVLLIRVRWAHFDTLEER
jgi:hypothetical protein